MELAWDLVPVVGVYHGSSRWARHVGEHVGLTAVFPGGAGGFRGPSG